MVMNEPYSPHGSVRIGVSLAYFRITSASLSLAEITRLTRENPDRGHSLGDVFTRPRMVGKHERTFSSWVRYSSAGQGLSVQRSLDGLFEPVRRIADGISARPEIACTLQIVQYPLNHEADIGFGFDASWLTLLASIPAQIDVDQYRP